MRILGHIGKNVNNYSMGHIQLLYDNYVHTTNKIMHKIKLTSTIIKIILK